MGTTKTMTEDDEMLRIKQTLEDYCRPLREQLKGASAEARGFALGAMEQYFEEICPDESELNLTAFDNARAKGWTWVRDGMQAIRWG